MVVHAGRRRTLAAQSRRNARSAALGFRRRWHGNASERFGFENAHTLLESAPRSLTRAEERIRAVGSRAFTRGQGTVLRLKRDKTLRVHRKLENEQCGKETQAHEDRPR